MKNENTRDMHVHARACILFWNLKKYFGNSLGKESNFAIGASFQSKLNTTQFFINGQRKTWRALLAFLNLQVVNVRIILPFVEAVLVQTFDIFRRKRTESNTDVFEF